jgi:hypothetical protein
MEVAEVFDTTKIARQALLRAEEIKFQKKKQAKLCCVASVFGLCAVSLGAFSFISLPNVSPQPYDFIVLDDMPVPLAAFPTEVNTPDNSFITAPILGFIEVDENKTYTGTAIKNSEYNNFHLVFEIVIQETAEVIFISEPVAPGMYTSNIELSRTLTKGEYEAILKIRSYEPHNGEPLKGITLPFLIISR